MRVCSRSTFVELPTKDLLSHIYNQIEWNEHYILDFSDSQLMNSLNNATDQDIKVEYVEKQF